MQTQNNPNYYLKHNFEKEYSDLGTPYVQENCDLLTSDNLVIYGHHIKGQKTVSYTHLLHSLVELKNALIRQGRDTDFIDELIFKVANAPVKKMKIEYV